MKPLRDHLLDPTTDAQVQRVRERVVDRRMGRRAVPGRSIRLVATVTAVALAGSATAVVMLAGRAAQDGASPSAGVIGERAHGANRSLSTPVGVTGSQSRAPLPIRSGQHLLGHHKGGAEGQVEFADGSELRVGPGTRVALTHNDGQALGLALSAGRVTLSIVPGGPRRWRVTAGDVQVEVLGTRFEVTRDVGGVRVSVERGKVRVRGEPGQAWRTLLAGDVASWPAPPSHGVAAHGDGSPRAVAPKIDGAFRDLARRGRYDAAFAALGRAGYLVRVRQAQRGEELQLLADVALYAGRPQLAARALRRLAHARFGHETAARGAFQLGRVQQDRLAQPARAAETFRRALSLGLSAGLVEDAHHRMAQAQRAAGDVDGAARTAQKYLSAYPDGLFRRAMGRLVQPAQPTQPTQAATEGAP